MFKSVSTGRISRSLHNPVKNTIFCNVYNKDLPNSPQMSSGSTITNQEVYENGVEAVILDCRKIG